MHETAKTFGLFVVAALCEIASAYLIWQWQRSGKPAIFALIGLAALFIYSLVQTIQSFSFGRAFAACGGMFILTALFWGWLVDGQIPDRWDWIGAGICVVGVVMIVAVPRS